jgi:hypothetical protein
LRTVPLCPFAIGSVLWQAQGGAWTLTVFVRGTFAIARGRDAPLAEAQESLAADRSFGDDPRQSLYTASDHALYKPRVDVTLVGSAFSAGPSPAEALIARLSLAELDKSIGVIGDRVWIEGPDGPEPSAPVPFRTMALRYERATRTRDNPVGFDLTRTPAAGALALPNLEAADDEVGRVRMIGFGPLPPSAPTRVALLTPEGRAWVEGGFQGPAPATFDFGYFNAAPRDQQIEVAPEGAPLVLEHMSPLADRIESRLPSVRPKVFLVPPDGASGAEIAMRCDTVWIDTDRAVLTLTWRGLTTVPTSDEDALGAIVVAAEGRGRNIEFAQIEKLVAAGLRTAAERDGEQDPLAETNRIVANEPRPRVEPAPRVVEGRAPISIMTSAPVVIEAEDSSTPLWDELSSSDLFEITSTEEPKTATQRRIAIEDPFTDEPSTAKFDGGARPPRRDLTPADYARIAAAVERGDAGRVLFAYGLTLDDLPGLTRMWTDRRASDPAFEGAFAQELAASRRRG